MTRCTCPIIPAPRGAKLKPRDQLARASEHLLRPRVLRHGDDPRVSAGCVKLTVGESDAPDGNLAEDRKRTTAGKGAHIVFQNPAFGGAVVAVPEHPDDAEAVIQVALAERLEHARFAATFRRMMERVAGDTTPAVTRCVECGGDSQVLDVTLDATHRDPNDLVYQSPAGYWLRTRIWRVSAGEPGMSGLEGASNVHFELSTAHCKENGDVVEDDRGHRILAPWRFTIAGRSLLATARGRPVLSEDGALAIRLVQRAMLPAEAEIQRIEALARFPFKGQTEPTYRELSESLSAAEVARRESDARLRTALVEHQGAQERLQAHVARLDAARAILAADLDRARARIAELEAAQPREDA